MTAVEETEGVRPLVMVVEDHPQTRRDSIALLESFGCDVVGADTADRAIAEVWALPRLDLVCADIGLDPRSANDMSGVRVARTIHEINPSIPVAAYSGKGFDLSREERANFQLVEIKGGGIDLDDLEEFFEDAVALARTRRAQLHDGAREAVAYSDDEETTVEDLRHILKRYVTDVSDPSAIESALESAGYKIVLVSPDATNGLRRPIIAWIQSYEDETIAQLFGRSSLYAIAPTEDEAVRRLIEVMREELTSLVYESGGEISEVDRELRSYLQLLLVQG